jgi:hypothetical protein
MSKLSLQLHILPSEVNSLLEELLSDQSVFVTLVEGTPLQFRIAHERRCEPERCKALCFTLTPPSLSARSLNDFRSLNPDVLVFEIGQLKAECLAESWLWAMTDNGEVMKRWKRAAKSIQFATLGGAVAVNPRSRATAPMKGHRFTSGAQALFVSGVAMLPAAGNSLVHLGTAPIPDPPPSTPRA